MTSHQRQSAAYRIGAQGSYGGKVQLGLQQHQMFMSPAADRIRASPELALPRRDRRDDAIDSQGSPLQTKRPMQRIRELSEAFSSGNAPGNASASCPNFAADVPSAMTGSVRRSVQYWDASPPGYSFAA